MDFEKEPHSGFRRTIAVAVLVVLGVVAFGWLVHDNTRSLVEEAQSVERTWAVIGEIESTLSTLKDAETGQRGYLLTGMPSFLTPYQAAIEAAPAHLSRLRAMTTDNPAQLARLREIDDLVKAKLDELAGTIRLHDAGDPAGALRTVEAGFGNQTMERIRETAASMRAEETRLLARRSLGARKAAARLTAASLIGGVAFLGLLAGLFAVARRDLLGRERAEAAAREIQEQLSTTLRSIGDAVLATDREGRVRFLNPVAEQLTGWSSADALGRPVEEVFRIVNENSRVVVDSPVRRVIRDGLIVGLANHTLLLARDGREIPIADSGAPIHDAQKAVAGVVLVFRDIAEQRDADRANQRLAAIVSSADFAMVAETVDNVITDWTPGAEALFGFSAAEMVGRKMSSLSPPDAPNPSPALTAELIAGRRVAEFDAQQVTKDGRWLDVVVTLSPIRDADGTVIGVSRLMRDVTERRRQSREILEARRRAEEASAAKDRFLATLSHELRTPLTPVMASVHRLERRPDLGAGMADSLAMIRRNVELEARLIDDLLDLTRIARGKVALDRAALDLHDVLASVVQSSRSEFFQKGVTLVTELAATDHNSFGDGGRLQQIFWNILKNAAKFTPQGGRVTVRSENPAPGRIRIAVTDTGRGIRPDSLSRIFEAFDQGDVTAVRRAGGLGLGLAIARSLVEMHGGTITAASGGEGLGATFAVELDTTAERPAVLPPAALPEDRAAARRRTSILVVEDDVDTAEGLQLLLSEAGFQVRVAGGLGEANRLFRERPADILVTDVGLPDGSGLDLLGALRQLRPDLGAIVLSGYGMEEDIARSHSLGFAEHFVKPLNLNRVIAALDSLGARTARG